MGKIIVIGSINADLITISDSFPMKGETIKGKSFTVMPGGKGANQAVAAAKLGGNVSFIGCVGNDANGKYLLNCMKKDNVCIDNIEVLDNVPTGIAQITVANNDNTIIVVPGANDKVNEEIIDKNKKLIYDAEIVMLQHEIPMKTVEYVIDTCYKKGIKVILNPAPSRKINKSIIDKVTYFTPNEIELEQIFNENRDKVLKKYPNKIIMTSGEKGVFYYDGKKIVNIEAYKVEVVDTTGAGDSFNGALAYALTEKYTLEEAIKFANKVASKTVQKLGAQTAMPTIKDLQNL